MNIYYSERIKLVKYKIPVGKWVRRTYREKGKNVTYWIYKDKNGKVKKRKARMKHKNYAQYSNPNYNLDQQEKVIKRGYETAVSQVPKGKETIERIEKATGERLVGGDSAYRRAKG